MTSARYGDGQCVVQPGVGTGHDHGLPLRSVEIRRHISLGYSYAVRTQTLIQTAIRTVTQLMRLYEQIEAILGNLSGQQNLSQHLTKLVQLRDRSRRSRAWPPSWPRAWNASRSR